MVSTLVRLALGRIGVQILELYQQNSLLVNGLIVLYGVFWTAAHVNYKHLKGTALQALRRRSQNLDANSARPAPGPAVGWEEIVQQESFFPFVANRNSFIPRRCSVETMDRLQPIAELSLSDQPDEAEDKGSGRASG